MKWYVYHGAFMYKHTYRNITYTLYICCLLRLCGIVKSPCVIIYDWVGDWDLLHTSPNIRNIWEISEFELFVFKSQNTIRLNLWRLKKRFRFYLFYLARKMSPLVSLTTKVWTFCLRAGFILIDTNYKTMIRTSSRHMRDENCVRRRNTK